MCQVSSPTRYVCIPSHTRRPLTITRLVKSLECCFVLSSCPCTLLPPRPFITSIAELWKLGVYPVRHRVLVSLCLHLRLISHPACDLLSPSISVSVSLLSSFVFSVHRFASLLLVFVPCSTCCLPPRSVYTPASSLQDT